MFSLPYYHKLLLCKCIVPISTFLRKTCTHIWNKSFFVFMTRRHFDEPLLSSASNRWDWLPSEIYTFLESPRGDMIFDDNLPAISSLIACLHQYPMFCALWTNFDPFLEHLTLMVADRLFESLLIRISRVWTSFSEVAIQGVSQRRDRNYRRYPSEATCWYINWNMLVRTSYVRCKVYSES